MNNLKSSLFKFLKKYDVTKKDNIILTHTCYGEPYGSYHIPDNKYPKFLNLYKKVIKYSFENNIEPKLHIIERHDGRDYGPLIIDIDYWTEKKDKERKYRQEHIENIISIISNKIKENFEIEDHKIEALVMEKERPCYDSKKNRNKDGFHIIYPISLSVKNRYYLFDLVKKEAIEKDIFKDIPYINKGGYDEIFDSSVLFKNGLTMYGSKKKNGQLYSLTCIYDNNMKQKKIEYDFDELVVLSSLRSYCEEEELSLKEKYKTHADQVYKNYTTKKVSIKINKDSKNINNRKKNRKKNRNDDDIDFVRKIVKILDKRRADIYNEWRDLGWALHSIDDRLLDDYINFSKQSPKWEPGCCEKIWNNAREIDNGITISSLYWWAQQDNPKKYIELMGENINQLLKEADTGTHHDIAKIIFEMYKHQYRCTSISKNIWYEFKNHRWSNIDSGFSLSMKIANELPKEYMRLAGMQLIEMSTSEDGFQSENIKKRYDRTIKIANNLKNQSFINQVMQACGRFFHGISTDFEEKLDSNPNIIGFNNGVYDLEKGYFRSGLPDDYISMTTGYDYQEYDDDDDEIEMVNNYFNTVMVEEDMKKYVMKFIASCLDGHSREQKFILWTGVGCHEKDTEILMYNGTKKKVQDIKCNENLMGEDGTPRRVKTLFTGEQDMFRIYLDNNESFVVNRNHRLALKNKFRSKIYSGLNLYNEKIYWAEWYEYLDNVPIKNNKPFRLEDDAHKYLKKVISNNKNYIYEDEVIPIMVNDYLKLDDEIRNNMVMYNRSLDMIYDMNIEDRINIVDNLVNKYGIHDKDDIRINKESLDDTLDVIIRSIGIRVENYDDYIIINRNDISNIEINKCSEYNIIKIENVGRDRFYGFEIDGDEKYLMGNLMVTYNSNGKSTTVDLMQQALGDYFGVLPTTVLTRKRGSSSNATPELADKRGKRVLFIQEPEHDDTVYVGLMKNLTGGDWIEARALYGSPFRYKPQFKLVLVCNKLPHIPANDQGTWRRLRVTPWESKFVDGEPKKKNEFKKDKKLAERIHMLNKPFVWLLLNKYYPDYKENGIEEPKKVTQFTDGYKKEQDIIAEYIGDNVQITNNKRDRVLLMTLYEGFRAFSKLSPKHQIPSKKEFTEYLKEIDGINVIHGTIHGIVMKEESIDVNSDSDSDNN